MADTAIAITAGTGTNVDTRTEATNGNHRQVVVIGDPSTNAGVAPVDATTGLAVNVTNASLTAAVASIAAGNNNIGDVDVASIAAGDNNIGNVDIVTVPTDPFGANADAGSATGSISAKLRFIAATGIPITGTVTVGSHAVTNAGTFLVQENGSWVQVDDAAFTPATSKIAMIGGEFDDSSPDSVDEGDGGAFRMSGRREQYIQIRDAAGNERGLNVSAAGSIGVTVASAGIASGAIASGAVASGAVASGAIASGAFASGSVGSGAVASGAIASGAVASGAFASGSISDGANVTLGAKADAKSTATDTTAITLMQVAKQISASAQLISTALGATALDLGLGTGGSRTLRVAVDTAQVDGSEYETVAASQTAQVLGATGGTGDFISGLLVVPATTSPGNVLLLDNATSITVFTGGATSVSNLVPFFIPLGMTSVSGAWKVTTGSNVSVIGVGNFT